MRFTSLCVALVCFICNSNAQSRSQDSTSLAKLYNETSGSDWDNADNWSTGPMNFWYGISIKNNLVWNISLADNNLSGELTAASFPNHLLGQVDLSSNSISGVPSSIKAEFLNLANNTLTFTHLLPYNTLGDSFLYDNQDSVETFVTLFAQQRSDIELTTSTDMGVHGIQYLWYFNGDSISGANASTLIISCVSPADSGAYSCRITHPDLAQLQLFRQPILLQVIKDAPDPGQNNRVCGEDYVMRGSNPVLGVGKWSLVSGQGTVLDVTDPNSKITNLEAGMNRFAWTVSHAKCPSESSIVTVVKDTIGELPIAGKDSVICDTTFTLNATSPIYGVGSWELISGSLIFAQPTNIKSNVGSIEPGQHILRWNVDNGACASFFDEVKITRVEPLTKSYAGKDTALCGTELFLDADKIENVTGVWTMVQGKGDVYASNIENSYVNNLDEGSNLLVWSSTNACNITTYDTMQITVHWFVDVNIGWDTAMYFTPSTPLILARNSASGGTGAYTYSWSPTLNLDSPNTSEGDFRPPDLGIYSYKLVVTDELGCSDSAEKDIDVIQVITLDIPTLFTPNNDGVNDYLVLPGIESYPESEFVIMDQFGQKVYSQKGYQNDWNGIGNNGFYSGQVLPEDTYFYFLDLIGEKDRVQKGFIVIRRD
ncbi:MAG: gliding motility-associated-like protein [Bacteroidia bacterium]|jgi:gliding motility-associated-like protein